MTTRKTIAFTRQTFVNVVMSLLFNTLSKGFPDSSVAKESSCNAGDPNLLENGWTTHSNILGLRLWLSCKESACNAGDLGSLSGLGRSPGNGNGYPLQYFGLENSMDSIVHGVAKN